MTIDIDIVKIFASAIVGFFIGRLQTSYSDKLARTKDIQNELTKAIRVCTTAAIEYHSLNSPEETRRVNAFHLKQQLLRIRTDVYLVKGLCKHTDDTLLTKLVDLCDAVSEYPFEVNELPVAPDKSRFGKISLAAEALVELLAACRPKLF